MKRIKRSILALLLLLGLLWGCQAKTAYADDLPCSALMDAAREQIPVSLGYASFDDEYRQACFPDADSATDACLCYSVHAEDINEIGIFRSSSDTDQKRIEGACQAYLDDQLAEKRAFLASYAPRELPKLERAEVRSFGSYTVYVILSDEDREAVFRAIEARLTPKA